MKEPLPPVANMLSVAWAGKWEEVDKMNINQTWMRCLTMYGMLRSRDILRENHSLTSA